MALLLRVLLCTDVRQCPFLGLFQFRQLATEGVALPIFDITTLSKQPMQLAMIEIPVFIIRSSTNCDACALFFIFEHIL